MYLLTLLSNRDEAVCLLASIPPTHALNGGIQVNRILVAFPQIFLFSNTALVFKSSVNKAYRDLNQLKGSLPGGDGLWQYTGPCTPVYSTWCPQLLCTSCCLALCRRIFGLCRVAEPPSCQHQPPPYLAAQWGYWGALARLLLQYPAHACGAVILT